jgi:hypothetical protein
MDVINIEAIRVLGGYCYSSDTYDLSVNIDHISTVETKAIQDYANYEVRTEKRGFFKHREVEVRSINFTELFRHTMINGESFYYTENLLPAQRPTPCN